MDPPADAGGRLSEWARSVSRGGVQRSGRPTLRVLGPRSLHLTLLFLGERPVEEIDTLAEALAAGAEAGRPCELEVGAPVWLPPRRPRALAVEVHDRSGELARLQGAVAEALSSAAGLPRPRRFRAHITLARMRAETRGDRSGPLPATPQLRFLVEEVVLYRSLLEPQAARYERVASAPLTPCGG